MSFRENHLPFLIKYHFLILQVFYSLNTFYLQIISIHFNIFPEARIRPHSKSNIWWNNSGFLNTIPIWSKSYIILLKPVFESLYRDKLLAMKWTKTVPECNWRCNPTCHLKAFSSQLYLQLFSPHHPLHAAVSLTFSHLQQTCFTFSSHIKTLWKWKSQSLEHKKYETHLSMTMNYWHRW